MSTEQPQIIASQPQLSEFERERRRKQEYLKQEILESNFDPEQFSDFMASERVDGDQIDNWSYEELETMVTLYKRQIKARQPQLDLAFKLEDIELNDDKSAIYARKVETARRQKTFLSSNRQTISIKKIEVLEGGFFYGKSLAFHVLTYPANLTVIRSEDQFKWLQETVAIEFPQSLIPPLVKVAAKVYDDETLRQYKYFYEKFLNCLASHKDLKHSLALDNFVRCKSKEELDIKKTEVESFVRRNVLLERNLTKKKFDGLNQNPLVVYPTPDGTMTLKISQSLKSHFVSSDQKWGTYELIFDKIDKAALEFEKAHKKLLKATENYRELVIELWETARKYNSSKFVKHAACWSEELVLGSISNFLNQESRLSSNPDFGGSGGRPAERRHLQSVPQGLLFRGAGRGRPAELCQQRVLQGEVGNERQKGAEVGD